MTPVDTLALMIIPVALILGVAFFRVRRETRTVADFPEYRHYNDGWHLPAFKSGNRMLGISFVMLWLASMPVLCLNGYEGWAVVIWVVSVGAGVIAVVLKAARNRTCGKCGRPLQIFHKGDRDGDDSMFGIVYLLVCDHCKEVRSEVVSGITGNG